MRITEVTNQDGILLAHLLNVFKVARFDNLTGPDIERVVDAKKFLQSLAQQAAEQLRTKSAPKVENNSFKVKSMGKLPSSNKKKK